MPAPHAYNTSRGKNDRRKGVAVTTVVHLGMLVCIFLFGVRYLDPPPAGGMIVAFGMTEDGAGSPAYNERIEPVTMPDPAAAVPQIEIPEEALVTQVEESPVVVPEPKPVKKEKKPEPKKQPEKPERTEPTPKAEETPLPPKPSQATSQALANILSPGNDASKGNGQGSGYKGSPDGSLSSDQYGTGGGMGGDGNYRLAGRSATSKPKPAYTGSDQGRVVVRVQVDRQGNVVSAKYTISGTSVTDPQLIRNAEDAARRTKWSEKPSAEPLQEGTIIYDFSIRG